jgi:Flp pilus assembly protein TadD
MKSLLVSALLAASLSGVAHAQPGSGGEIGYPRGSIGYDALVAGDNQRAVSQILNGDRVSRRDPALLINLGQAYARMGRTAEAAELFTQAMQSRESVELVLADGRIMNSKEAARQAFSGLKTKIATR